MSKHIHIVVHIHLEKNVSKHVDSIRPHASDISCLLAEVRKYVEQLGSCKHLQYDKQYHVKQDVVFIYLPTKWEA